jgi:hypothetical protein
MPAELDERAVRQTLRALGVESLEVRRLEDALFSSSKKTAKEGAERSWQGREAYLRSLAGFNVYIAPRRHEGIGMAFLEAMAMGMCVVAENHPTANEYILSGKNGVLYGGDREKIYPPRRVELLELARIGGEARETIRRIHGDWLAKRIEILQCVEGLLQRRMEPKVPPAGLLNLTINFWQDQKGFWESFGSGDSGIWRSCAIEKKGRRARSVVGRIRTFWRHLKVAARRGSEAVGSDGQPYSQSS